MHCSGATYRGRGPCGCWSPVKHRPRTAFAIPSPAARGGCGDAAAPVVNGFQRGAGTNGGGSAFRVGRGVAGGIGSAVPCAVGQPPLPVHGLALGACGGRPAAGRIRDEGDACCIGGGGGTPQLSMGEARKNIFSTCTLPRGVVHTPSCQWLAVGRAAIHCSRSVRCQPMARLDKLTWEGNLSCATRRLLVERPKPVNRVTAGSRRNVTASAWVDSTLDAVPSVRWASNAGRNPKSSKGLELWH